MANIIGAFTSWTDYNQEQQDFIKVARLSGKRIFDEEEPHAPYEIGDLWLQGSLGGISKCHTDNLDGAFNANHWAEDATNYDNTKTIIDDGLVTTGTLELEDSIGNIKAGITASGSGDDQVRIWAGGIFAEKEDAPFRVLQNGDMYASKGIFTGDIFLKDGKKVIGSGGNAMLQTLRSETYQQMVGWVDNEYIDEWTKTSLIARIFIPPNFVIEQARVGYISTPAYWFYEDYSGSFPFTAKEGWGYARKLKLYNQTHSNYATGNYPYMEFSGFPGEVFAEIGGALYNFNDGFTRKNPNEDVHGYREQEICLSPHITVDILDNDVFVPGKFTVLKVETSEDDLTSGTFSGRIDEAVSKTEFGQFFIEVVGYSGYGRDDFWLEFGFIQETLDTLKFIISDPHDTFEIDKNTGEPKPGGNGERYVSLNMNPYGVYNFKAIQVGDAPAGASGTLSIGMSSSEGGYANEIIKKTVSITTPPSDGDILLDVNFNMVKVFDNVFGFVVEYLLGVACLSGDTNILTKQGLINIENIKVGDEILVNNNEHEFDVVNKKLERLSDHYYLIELDNEVIKATGSHRFLMEKAFEYVMNLEQGDLLLNSNGNFVKINKITRVSEDIIVYEIKTTKNKEYITGYNNLVCKSEDI